MAFLDWSGTSQVGVRTMDFEHGCLVKQMNELHTRWIEDAPRATVGRALHALYDGTLAHFRHEEAHMRQHRHSGTDGHRRTHRHLMRKLAGFRDAFVKGSNLEQEFFDFLEEWLCVHILEVDASYADDVAA